MPSVGPVNSETDVLATISISLASGRCLAWTVEGAKVICPNARGEDAVIVLLSLASNEAVRVDGLVRQKMNQSRGEAER